MTINWIHSVNQPLIKTIVCEKFEYLYFGNFNDVVKINYSASVINSKATRDLRNEL